MEGIIALTPLAIKPDEEIDYEAIRGNIQLLSKKRVPGFLALAGMGQYNAPSEDEFNKIVDASMEAASANQITVIGTTSANTREAIRRTKYAEDAGADGVMLAVPYAFPMTGGFAVEHYRMINRSIRGEMGIMVYNTNHGINITPELWDQLLKLEHIKALKESIGDVTHRNRILFKLADKINVFSGSELQFWSDSILGGKGIIGIDTWMAPEFFLKFYGECRKGNQLEPWTLKAYETIIRRGGHRGLDLGYLTSGENSWHAHKQAYLNKVAEMCGGRAGPPRKPHEQLSEKNLVTLREYAQELRSLLPEGVAPVISPAR